MTDHKISHAADISPPKPKNNRLMKEKLKKGRTENQD